METPAGRRLSLTHSTAAATAAPSPRSQWPPAQASLFPSLLRNTRIIAAGPWQAADSEGMRLLLQRAGEGPPAPAAPPATWWLCGRVQGASRPAPGDALLDAAREESCFLIVQVPLGAVVKQLREGVRKSRCQREGGRENRARKAQGERKRCWKTQ